MSRIGKALLTVVLTAISAIAQPITNVEQMPALDRTQADFYGAIVGAGARVQIEWLLAPATVERGNDVQLTLVVTNAANPTELQRPKLTERPEFRELFEVIENLPDEVNAQRVEFRYKLRPRNEGAFVLPLPKYRFYQPQAPEGRRFQIAPVPELKLTVTKPAPINKPASPMVDSGIWFEFREPGRFPAKPSPWYWYALVTVVPLMGAGWVAYHWLRHPGERRLAQIHRVRAVRAAMNSLERAEDAGAVTAAFRCYLQERLKIPPEAQTPREIAVALGRSAMETTAVEEVEQLLNDCERERFAESEPANRKLKGAAAAWILKHESRGT